MKGLLLFACLLIVSAETEAKSRSHNHVNGIGQGLHKLYVEWGLEGNKADKAKPVRPKVSCDLMYDKVDERGISENFLRLGVLDITEEGVILSRNGFVFEGKLQEVCAPDAPDICGGYELEVRIKKKGSQSYLSTEVAPLREDEYGRRYSTSLDYGRENFLANCDVE